MTGSPQTGDSKLATSAWARDAWIRALERTAPLARGDGATLPAVVTAMAASQRSRLALLDEGACLTYDGLATRMACYASWTLRQGVQAGEVVALILPNCAEYMAVWLGITSVRSVAALVNPNLTGGALLHALAAVSARHVIVGAAFEAALADIVGSLPPDIRIWSFAAGGRWPSLDASDPVWPEPDGPAVRLPRLSDPALYIYTSGTGAVVYGVPVPGTEGRAGMASLEVAASFDLRAFRRHIEARLPAYARPVFLRLSAGIAATATFKPVQAQLAEEGYDLDRVSDPLYIDDRSQAAFVPLDRALHDQLKLGERRL